MKPQLVMVAKVYGSFGVALMVGGATQQDAGGFVAGTALLLGGLVLWRSVRGRWL